MSKREIWICCLLGLGSLIIRMLLISKGPFSPESLNLALKAETTLDTFQLQYLFGTGYPLTVLLTATTIFIGRFMGIEDPVFAANLMSVYTSTLSIPLLYLLVKRLLDDPTAVFSALLFSVCPIFMGVSVYGKGHAPAMLFAFAGLLALLRAIENKDYNFYILSGILIGCLGAVRVQDMVFVVPAAAFLILLGTHAEKEFRFSQERILELMVFGIAALLTTFLFHVPYLLGEGRTEYLQQYQNFRQLSISSTSQQNYGISLPLYREWFLMNFSIYGLVAYALGFLLMLRDNWRMAIFCLLWFVVPLGFYMLINTTIPRFFTIFIPAVMIPIAFFLGYGYRRMEWLTPSLGTAIAVLITAVIFMNGYPIFKSRHDHALVPEYVQWVKSQVPPNSRMICKDDFIFYEHYGDMTTLTRPNPTGKNYLKGFDAYRDRLNGLLRQGIPVYVSGVGLYSYDPQRQVAKYLRQHFILKEVGRQWYEDYHAGELNQIVFQDPLFQIMPNE